MGLPLSELGERMTADEFGLHLADYRRNPWGPHRQEFDTALICAAIHASHGGKCAPSDFMPYRKRAAPADSADKIQEFLRGL